MKDRKLRFLHVLKLYFAQISYEIWNDVKTASRANLPDKKFEENVHTFAFASD